MRKEKIIIGPPSEELLRLEKMGELVICELKHLQNLNELEIEVALTKEPAIWRYKYVCIDASKLPQAYFDRIIAKANGEPVVIASTEQLVVRESIVEDAEAFAMLYADEDVRKFVECPEAKTIEEFQDYIKDYVANQYGFYEYGMWSVIEKESGEVIGRMGVELQENNLSLGYALLPAYRGKGYAYEACMAILDYCKICDYSTEIFVKIDDNNIKSKKLFQKLQKYSTMTISKIKTKGCNYGK